MAKLSPKNILFRVRFGYWKEDVIKTAAQTKWQRAISSMSTEDWRKRLEQRHPHLKRKAK